jgi:hypothetical protein
MIRQYLSNTKESATMSILQNFLELNKALGTRNFTKTQRCAIAELASLVLLNLSRCGICDEGCENLEGKHDAN